MPDFTDSVVLITGAANGIGRATARAFAEAGASVTLTDVDDDAGEKTAGSLGATYRHLDVTNADAVRDVVQRARPAASPHRRRSRGRCSTSPPTLRRT